MTPLILAAKQDHADLVQYFVTNTDADLNIQAEEVRNCWHNCLHESSNPGS